MNGVPATMYVILYIKDRKRAYTSVPFGDGDTWIRVTSNLPAA